MRFSQYFIKNAFVKTGLPFLICNFLLITNSYAAVITSVNTGNWNNSATWDCGCVPTSTDDAVIANGHTVTITSNSAITNLTINAGGILTDNGRRIDISGNYAVNGEHAGTGVINLDGIGTTISGTGLISNSRIIRVNNGNQTIIASANLTFSSAPFRINGAYTITNNGTVVFGDNLVGAVGAATWTNAVNSSLTANGALLNIGILNASAGGNTIEYAGTGNQTIKDPSASTYHHLKLTGSLNKRLENNVIINGDLTINSTLDVMVANYSVTLAGNWTNNGSFDEQNGTVTLNGSGDQSITNSFGETFYNFTINKSGGQVNADYNINVSNILAMTSGNIDLNGYALTLGTDAVNIGTLTYSSGNIVGIFTRWINATGTGILFPIATTTNYLPALVTFTNLTPGTLTTQFSESDPGKTGLPLPEGGDTTRNTFVEGYWALTAGNGLASTNYDMELTGNGFTSFTINGTTRILKRSSSGNPWTLNGFHVAAVGNTAKRSGLSGFSEFAFGDTTNCQGPVTSVISGTDSVCTNTSGYVYSVTNTPGSTYTWIVSGGNITSGQGTSSITVDWGSTGMAGSVQVTETNTCTSGAPVLLGINIHSLPVSSISGKTSVAEYTNGETYSLAGLPGYSYTWTITGGSLVSGQGTSTITVNWGAGGSGNVRVVANSACGSSPPTDLPITIYIIVNSVASGNWNNTSVWDCSCVPTSTDNVVINSTHTITLNANTSINHFTIKTGGTLFDNNRTLTVTGNVLINGNYTGSRNLILNGGNTSLDGTGTISNSNVFRFNAGSTTILSTASLTISPATVQVNNGAPITNKGSVVIGGNMQSNDPTSSWRNDVSSSLTIGGSLFATGGILLASDANNTVTYNGTGQSVLPVSYFNLTTSGPSTTTLTADLTAAGDVNISNTLNSNNFNINAAGNWTNTGTFTPGTGTVTFDGNSTQTIDNGTSSFNNVIIGGSGTKILANNITINTDLTINSTLDVSASNYNISLAGNWNNTGTFTPRSGTITFNGLSAQTISGTSGTFNNVTVNNTNGVSLSSSQNLAGTLTLSAGNFTTTGYSFTLLSTASSTARIAAIPGGSSVIGNITMQRYIQRVGGVPEGFREIGSAVSSGVINDLQDDFLITGLTGASFPTWWPSVYTYDESKPGIADTGWVAETNVSNALTPGKGYLFYIFDADIPATIDVTGSPNMGSISLPVAFTSTPHADDGMNFVANPYPCEIDWDAAGWTKTNINDAIYIWRNDIQQYASYVFGVGTNGGTQYIPSSQAFYVQANASGPSLVTSESVKTATNPSFFRTAQGNQDILTLEIAGNSYTDETVIRFLDGSTTAFDGPYDALKSESSNPNVPYLASLSTDSIKLSINSQPEADQNDLVIPLIAKTGTSGTYTISVKSISGVLWQNTCLILEDLQDSSVIDLSNGNSYIFTMNASTGEVLPRFLLHYTPPISISKQDAFCGQSNNGFAVATKKGTGPWSYEWKDEGNTIIRTSALKNESDTLNNMATGTYYVTASRISGYCSSHTDTIIIQQLSSLSTSLTPKNPTCKGVNNGFVTTNISGGTPPYTYQWLTGETTNAIYNLSSGTYKINVTDSLGCTLSDSATLTPAVTIQAGFTTPTDTLYLPAGNTIQFTNTSTGATAYVWDFDDSSGNVYSTDPVHTFNNERAYTVTLIASNGSCSDTAISVIRVLNNPLSVLSNQLDPTIKVFSSPEGKVYVLIKNYTEKVNLSVYNTLGQKIQDIENANKQTVFDLSSQSQGIYIIKAQSGKRTISQKVLYIK